MLWALLIVVLGATNIAASFSEYRLPENVKPVQYTLEVQTLLEPNFSFSGSVWIKIDCITPTRSIVLNSKDLVIAEKGIKLRESSDNDDSDSSESDEVTVSSVQEDKENEIIIINLEEALKQGVKYTLLIPFAGILSEEPEGYYRGSYIDQKTGKTRWYAVTNFHYTNARKAFPCFDQTDKKANFTVRFVHRSDLKAFSNLPLFKTLPNQSKLGYSYSYFLASPPMSTYLLGYMVSDFEAQELPVVANVKLGLLSREEVVPQTQFVKDATPKLFNNFQSLIDFDYPLAKLDLAVVPKMSASGVDGWGLINFKESDVLYDSRKPSLRRQRFIADLVSHELIDQVIENVVTMKGWNNLWLYESLANFFGKLNVNEVFDEWGFFDDASLDLALSVFDDDSAHYAEPVSKGVIESKVIRKLFDHQSYNKGSYLFRMIYLALGEQALLAGVSNFLSKYYYSNAEDKELWEEITTIAHTTETLDRRLTLNEIMDSWTKQTGYPLLTVTRNYEKGIATITQKRLLRPKPDGFVQNKSKWWIPITYTTQKNPDFLSTTPKLWMNPSQEVVELKNLDSRSWLLLNINTTGLYKVKYDDENWRMLTDVLNSDRYDEISALNRADLLMTAFDLAWVGEIPYSKAIPLINYLLREKEWLPWKVALKRIGDIRFILMRSSLFKGSHIGGYFKDYVSQLLTPYYESNKNLTQIPDSYYDSELHYKMSAWTIRFEMGDIQAQALPLFVNWMKTKNPDDYNPIPEGLREDIYCNSIWFEGNDRWEFLLQRYKFSQEGVDRNTIMEGLACSQDKAILKKFLELSIQEDSVIRREDSFYVFGALAKHTPSFPICFEFLQTRIKDIYAYHSGRSDIIGAYMKVYAENIHTKEELQKFQEFVSLNQQYLKDTVLPTSLGIQGAQANINWYETNFDAFNEVLKEVTTRPGGISNGKPI